MYRYLAPRLVANHGTRMSLSNLLVHSQSDLNNVWDWMHFSVNLSKQLDTRLPTRNAVMALLRPLKHSSCAVVGASSVLLDCAHAHDICLHDVIIHVNDHQGALQFCKRVDIQFVNAHSCYWIGTMHPVQRLFNPGRRETKPSRGPLRECQVHPRRARIRHEWNPKRLPTYATGTFLSSGWASSTAHRAVGKCCASAGGVAVAFAVSACKTVTTYGLGGINHTHVDNDERGLVGVHNMRGELRWLKRMERRGTIVRRC